jgi:hypothetical protein
MEKYKNSNRYQNRNNKSVNSFDVEQNEINELQKQHHQIAQKSQQNQSINLPQIQITASLENGVVISGKAMVLTKTNTQKSRVFFNDCDGHELRIDAKGNINSLSYEEMLGFQTAINHYLYNLQEEANTEFPAWLEKYSTKADNMTPYFTLDEIHEKFKCKKFRFGLWRIAMQVGFFDDSRPQQAKLNKIVKLEVQKTA